MIITTETDGFEMKAAAMLEGARDFVILPGLSPRSVMPAAKAVERAYASKLKDTRLILMDRRETVHEGYTMEEMAEDTARVLKKLGVQKAVFFGASQGGMIAQLIAVHHPETVSGLILGSTTPKITPETESVLMRWIALAEAGEGDRLADRMIADICSKRMAERFSEILTAGLRGLTPEELRRFVILARACLGYDAEPLLNNITCPVYVIGAEGDAVMGPEPSKRLAELTHAKELYLYGPEYGHNVYDEAQDYAARVASYIEHMFENKA